MTALTDVILASASPRRVELLRSLGFRVDVRPTQFPEDDVPGLTPRELAAHHSAAKCNAALAALAASERAARAGICTAPAPGVVVAADTVVDLDGRALGKPHDIAEARAMLAALSGREHLVHTALDLAFTGEGRRAAFVETAAVRFFDLDDATVRAYAGTRDGLDKAGAYGIQGLGAALVERIDGDFYAVMGFPIGRFVRTLATFGFAPPAFADALAGMPA